MFNNEWFRRNQKILVFFANTFIGRLVFGFYLNKTKVKKVVKISPNSVHWLVGTSRKKIYIKSEFLTDNQYSKRLFYILYPIWFLFHVWDTLFANNFQPAWNLGFDTLTVYPDAHPESTSVDGDSATTGSNATWATLHDAASGTSGFTVDNGATARLGGITTGTTSNRYANIYRSFFLFDTHTLTANADVSAAVLSLYPTVVNDSLNSSLDIVSTTPASNTALVEADFDQFGTTVFSTIDFTSITINQYNNWTLNASGIAAVSKTDISKFGGRNSHDTANSPSWSSDVDDRVIGYMADQGSNKPKLVVTYSLPVSSGIFLTTNTRFMG